MPRFTLTAARWVFGLFYASTGIAIACYVLFGVGTPPKQPTLAATAFTEALSQSGFIDPMLAVVYILGGLALLRERTAPAGIVLLAPVVSVIFCFHLVLSGQWIWGTVNFLWLLALAYAYRASFVPLWRHASAGGVQGR
jgi:putative oxidoreductase